MLEKFVEDSRYARTKTLLTQVFALSGNMPKVIVVIAAAGVGKTTLLRYLSIQLGWCYFVVKDFQSVSWLTSALADEICGYSYSNIRENYQAIIGALRQRPRGLIIDEAHGIARNSSRFEVLRYISDEAGVPLVLSGTEDLARAIHALPPLESRVAGWTTIALCNFADVKLFAEELCEIAIADDLLKTVLEVTAGSARGIVIALSRLESLAHRRGMKRLRLADIPERFSFTYSTRNRRHAIATDGGATNETPAPALKVVG
jgi:DNA transposition AAA+ family ATPase